MQIPARALDLMRDSLIRVIIGVSRAHAQSCAGLVSCIRVGPYGVVDYLWFIELMRHAPAGWSWVTPLARWSLSRGSAAALLRRR